MRVKRPPGQRRLRHHGVDASGVIHLRASSKAFPPVTARGVLYSLGQPLAALASWARRFVWLHRRGCSRKQPRRAAGQELGYMLCGLTPWRQLNWRGRVLHRYRAVLLVALWRRRIAAYRCASKGARRAVRSLSFAGRVAAVGRSPRSSPSLVGGAAGPPFPHQASSRPVSREPSACPMPL